MYLPLKSDDVSVKSLFECLEDVTCWRDNSFLQLNDKKTEMKIFAPSNCVNNISEHLGPRLSNLHVYVKQSGFYF